MTIEAGNAGFERAAAPADSVNGSLPPGTYLSMNYQEKIKYGKQWYSADRTKKFATDDPSSVNYVVKNVPAPNQYAPKTAIADKYDAIGTQRFALMGGDDIKEALKLHLDNTKSHKMSKSPIPAERRTDRRSLGIFDQEEILNIPKAFTSNLPPKAPPKMDKLQKMMA